MQPPDYFRERDQKPPSGFRWVGKKKKKNASKAWKSGFTISADDGSYDVVLTKLTWRKAQSYCRQNGKDLARVRSQTENKAVQEVLNGNSSSFWMGLFRDAYKWSDQSDSPFRSWQSTQPNNDGHCTLYSPVKNLWWDRSCGHQSLFYCYDGELFEKSDFRTWSKCSICVHLNGKEFVCSHSTAIRVTRWMMLKVKSNSSLHFHDSKTSHALLNQASDTSAWSFCCCCCVCVRFF